MTTTNNIPASILNNSLVSVTIAAIRIMWDTRNEKSEYNRVNWLDGMDAGYSDVLSMLFAEFATGEETTKTFARRIAGI